MNKSGQQSKGTIYGIIVGNDSLMCAIKDESEAKIMKTILEDLHYSVIIKPESVKESNFESKYKQFTLSKAYDYDKLITIQKNLDKMASIFANHFQINRKPIRVTDRTKIALQVYIAKIKDVSRMVTRKIIIEEHLDEEICIPLSSKQKKILEVFNGICVLLRRNIPLPQLLHTILIPRPLSREDLNPPSEPEAFTKYTIIEPILTVLGYEGYYPEACTKSNMKVDYAIPSMDHKMILLEAKMLGSKTMFNRTGAKNQVKKYIKDWDGPSFGIATDGMRWLLVTESPLPDVPINNELVDLRAVFLDLILIGVGLKSKLEDESIQALDRFIDIFSKDTIYAFEDKLRKLKRSYNRNQALLEEGKAYKNHNPEIMLNYWLSLANQ